MILEAESLCVRRVRLAAPAAELVTARLRVEAALGQAARQAPGLPASATLCVRRLRGAMPPRLSSNLTANIHGQSWKAGFDGALARQARIAARPVLGAVPADAEAVVFLDTAELLACLALDWLRGDAAARWWWRAMFPSRNLTDAVGRAWAANPERAPDALVRLHQTGQSSAFLRSLPSTALVAICTNVARTHSVQELRKAIQQAGDRSVRTAAVDGRGCTPGAGLGSAPEAVRTGRPPTPPPWSRWLAAEPGLDGEAQTLLVLSVLLTKAPAAARSSTFLADVRDFAAARGGLSHMARTESRSPVRSGMEPVADGLAVEETGTPARVLSTRPSANGPRDVSAEFPPTPGVGDPGEDWPAGVPVETGQAAANIRNDATFPARALEPPPECLCSTSWGGVFYLINVALALELYGDFTRPNIRSLPMPLWDFLALAGRALIGPEFAEDCCMNLFAQLSGRKTDDPPGTGCGPLDEWLPPFGTPPDRAGLQSLALEDWVTRIAGRIEDSLVRALGEPDRGVLRDLVFRHHARVRADSERVLVCFSLASHPVALRVAGVDRDPGWIPAAGRKVLFAYE